MEKNKIAKFKTWLAQFTFVRGVYFFLLWIYKLPGYILDYVKFYRLSLKEKRFSINILRLYPRLFDNTDKTHFDPHYTYHPAWAARIVAKTKPSKHVDISSILHFSTLVSAFVPVEFYDYRPAEVRLDNLQCKKGNLMALPFPDDSVQSLSCMHTIEHIGLGRYGDPIDPDGDIKAAKELKRVLRKGGTFLYVAPIGKPRLEFNAHRIYSYEQVMKLFEGLELIEFSMVPDDFKAHGLIKDADKGMVKSQNCACGCFWFTKR
jgi:SAM-dependent methyltransferase